MSKYRATTRIARISMSEQHEITVSVEVEAQDATTAAREAMSKINGFGIRGSMQENPTLERIDADADDDES